MRVLFVHNNFPGQFRLLAQVLARDETMQVAAIGCETARSMLGVDLHSYRTPAVPPLGTHPFARRFDYECRRAEQVLYAATSLAASGFEPDVILAHTGWGEGLPLRSVFPKARIVVYCEFYYRADGQDVGFDPEFPAIGIDGKAALHAKNASGLLGLMESDIGLSPTAWQRSTFPDELQPKITVAHDGIDTDFLKPDPNAVLQLPSGATLTSDDEVVTYVSRNLEPMRGFHIFMRSLPQLLRRRKNAHVVVVGGDGVSYGQPPEDGVCWREFMLRELEGQLDLSRVHFMGRVSYGAYVQALQISSAHVYLTYPFVLSWSLLEAMSLQCLVVGSDTPPVREVVDEETGVLVPFFEHTQLADAVDRGLRDAKAFAPKRREARRRVQGKYDFERISLPRLREILFG